MLKNIKSLDEVPPRIAPLAQKSVLWFGMEGETGEWIANYAVCICSRP